MVFLTTKLIISPLHLTLHTRQPRCDQSRGEHIPLAANCNQHFLRIILRSPWECAWPATITGAGQAHSHPGRAAHGEGNTVARGQHATTSTDPKGDSTAQRVCVFLGLGRPSGDCDGRATSPPGPWFRTPPASGARQPTGSRLTVAVGVAPAVNCPESSSA
jgi:hypothetical protein